MNKVPTPKQFIKSADKQSNILVMPFSSLPPNHQMALVWYMAVDGEAWNISLVEDPLNNDWSNANVRRVLRRHMRRFVDVYGGTEWGIGEVLTKDLTAYVWRCMSEKGIWGSDFDSFQQYHEWYIENDLRRSGKRHNMQQRWPIIYTLNDSGFDDTYYDPIEDGWHRFHAYVRAKHSTIPIVYSWN